MFIFGHLFIGIAKLLHIVFNIYYFVLVIRILMSWINPDPYNEIVKTIYKLTDPVLEPIRKHIPLQIGMLDLSPILVFLLLNFVDYFLVNTLLNIGQRMLG